MLLLLSACITEPEPSDTGDTSTDTSSDTSSDTSEDTGDTADTSDDTSEDTAGDLEEHQSQWASHGLDTYTYVLEWHCFCPEEMTGPATVEVVEGVVASARYVSTEAPVTDAFDARTIEGLFELLAMAVTSADSIDVTWDATYGHPAHAYIDFELDADDDELGFTVTDLAPG